MVQRIDKFPESVAGEIVACVKASLLAGLSDFDPRGTGYEPQSHFFRHGNLSDFHLYQALSGPVGSGMMNIV